MRRRFPFFARLTPALVCLAFGCAQISPRADTHIYLGAVGTNQNNKLAFSNGILFDAAKTNFALRCPPGISNLLERAATLIPPAWEPAAPPFRGNNNLQTLTDTNAPAGTRFYRLRQLNNLP